MSFICCSSGFYVINRDYVEVAVVGGNLHREHTLLSGKAFGYNLKMEGLFPQRAFRQLSERWGMSQISDKWFM